MARELSASTATPEDISADGTVVTNEVRPKVKLPATTPDPFPQLLACGERTFARLGANSLQVFELLPDAKREARPAAHIDLPKPLNLISLAGESRLVITASKVFRHYRTEKSAPSFARIPVLGPLVAWPDARDIDGFWVRYLRDPSLHHYTLARAPEAAPSESQPAVAGGDSAVTIGEVQLLPGFDRRLFTLMADGTPFYSTSNGLERGGSTPRRSPLPSMPNVVALWAGSNSRQYWAASALGFVGLWEQSRGEPQLVASRVEGAVLQAAVRGKTTVIVSVELASEQYRVHVSTFDGRARGKEWALTPTHDVQPVVDVCLLGAQPRVLVGGREWLQLFDVQSGALLGEW